MKEQLIDAWRTNNRMNILLIDGITDKGLQTTLSKRGGRNVYQQFLHLDHVRKGWLEVCANDIFKRLKSIEKETNDRKILKEAIMESSTGLEELFSRSWDLEGKVKGFKKGLFPMLGYFISHESHHRGNILLTLKSAGEKIPDKVKWGLWEWNK